MKEQRESELYTELAALRQRLTTLEAEREAAQHQASRAQWPTSLRKCLLGPLPLALLIIGGGLLYAQGDALFIDSKGNVGIGSLTPQGFQVVLPETSKPSTAPNAGITMAGGVDGNASIEVRNNGTGNPYIDFARLTTTDYDARLRLTKPKELAIEGATLIVTKGYIPQEGGDAPDETLQVRGNAKINGGVTSQAVYQRDMEAETKTYEISPRYHMSLTAARSFGQTQPIPEKILIDLCGDADGCEVRMGKTRWMAGSETAAASRSYLFYYSATDKHWQSSFQDTAGTIGNGKTEIAVAVWGCALTDGTYRQNIDQGDTNAGMALLVSQDSSFLNAGRTCELTLID
ncbi:MAG: hypothetical protein JSR62_06450 [Nitrospira sp.]|nr:hypothetical protein [Nitrospira sp.]